MLDRLRERMLEQRAKGVTVAQMHEVLKARGIEIGERSLKTFLDKGELPGGRRGRRRRRRWRSPARIHSETDAVSEVGGHSEALHSRQDISGDQMREAGSSSCAWWSLALIAETRTSSSCSVW